MTKLLFILLMPFCLSAQFIADEYAVLPECKDELMAAKCSTEKLKHDFAGLITTDIAAHLKQTLPENHFTLSVVFLTDSVGKLIPGETEVVCHNGLLKKAIFNYISNLPVFYIKNGISSQPRTVHSINLVFLPDASGNYVIAEKEQLRSLNIKPKFRPLDKNPRYPGCESEINDKAIFCLQQAVMNFVLSKYKEPKYSGPLKQIKMYADFIIEKDGSVLLKEVSGGEAPFREEVERIMKKLPKVTPAEIKGIVVKISFSLPITINL